MVLAFIARRLAVLLIGLIAWEERTDVGFPGARTGGKCTFHYNILGKRTPVIFVAPGVKASID